MNSSQNSSEMATKHETKITQNTSNADIFEFEVIGSKPTTIFIKASLNASIYGMYDDTKFDLPFRNRKNHNIYIMTICFGSTSTFSFQLNVTNQEMLKESIGLTVFTADYEELQDKPANIPDYASVITSNTFITRYNFVLNDT